MIKRIISLILLTGIISAAIPVFADAPLFGEDYSKRIDVSDFKYILKDPLGAPMDELIPEGTVSVSFKAKRTSQGTGDQSCTLVVTVYDGGKLYATKTKNAVIPEDGSQVTVKLSSAIELPSDISNLRIYSYIWTDLTMPRILARPATYRSSVNTLYQVSVNGEDMDADSVFDEDGKMVVELDKLPKNLPVVTAKADDLTAKIAISNAESLPGEATINVTSNTGDTKNYTVEFKVKENVAVVENAITDDACSRANYWSDWYDPVLGTFTQVNIYNGAKVNSNSHNGTLKRALFKIDVTKFPSDVELIKDITLTVVGNQKTENTVNEETVPSFLTVNAYDFSDFEWDEATIVANSSSASYVGPTITDIMARTPFSSFIVERGINWTEKTISIRDVVINAKKEGKESITIILFADNTERANLTGRDELIFQMGTKEHGTEAYRPKVTLTSYEKEE